MMDLYPDIEPYKHGMLSVGDGNLVYWEECGNPRGKPAIVFHGGPGSGCTRWHRRLFDPDAYRIVLFDQRNCGRSIPNASAPGTDLSSNNTNNLIVDIELLRLHLAIDRWLVLGGSWGSTLALAYAEMYPDRVSELILFGVTTGRHKEFDWLFRGGVAVFFPEEWERLRSAVPASKRTGDVVEQYYQLLNDSDPMVRRRAAESWCLWESATPEPPIAGLAQRFKDHTFAISFARLVTHYVRANAWIEDDILLRNANLLARIPGIIVNGRFDFQTPISNAWELKQVWPSAGLVIVDNTGHAANAQLEQELVRATNKFARSN